MGLSNVKKTLDGLDGLDGVEIACFEGSACADYPSPILPTLHLGTPSPNQIDHCSFRRGVTSMP